MKKCSETKSSVERKKMKSGFALHILGTLQIHHSKISCPLHYIILHSTLPNRVGQDEGQRRLKTLMHFWWKRVVGKEIIPNMPGISDSLSVYTEWWVGVTHGEQKQPRKPMIPVAMEMTTARKSGGWGGSAGDSIWHWVTTWVQSHKLVLWSPHVHHTTICSPTYIQHTHINNTNVMNRKNMTKTETQSYGLKKKNDLRLHWSGSILELY